MSAMCKCLKVGRSTFYYKPQTLPIDTKLENAVVKGILKVFGIKRSLSAKGTPVDNAVAESMYNVIKIEFTFKREFKSIEELELYWFDYVNWYNNVRIHGSLGYLSPTKYEIANI